MSPSPLFLVRTARSCPSLWSHASSPSFQRKDRKLEGGYLLPKRTFFPFSPFGIFLLYYTFFLLSRLSAFLLFIPGVRPSRASVLSEQTPISFFPLEVVFPLFFSHWGFVVSSPFPLFACRRWTGFFFNQEISNCRFYSFDI